MFSTRNTSDLTLTLSCRSNDNAPKTNKRFLSTIVKSADEHNKAILKAQADAALEIKQQREQEEKEERRRRAEEARNARIQSEGYLSHWSRRHDYDDDRDWRERRDDDRLRERSYQNDRRHGGHRKRRRSADDELDNDRQRKRRRDPSEDYDERRDHHQERKRERSLERDHRSSRRRQNSPERKHTSSPESCEERERRHRDSEDSQRYHRSRHLASSRDNTENRPSRKKARREHSTSPEPRCKSSTRRDANGKVKTVVGDRTPSPDLSAASPSIRDSAKRELPAAAHRPRSPDSSEDEIGPTPPQYSSKMDKYFAADYDPRLDLTPALASDGFLPPGGFEGWDAMLQVIRLRREEKEDRKRLEKPGKPSRKKATGDLDDIFAIEYTKRGSTREWDEGKKEPT
jgi:hypothetical protein